MHLPWGFACLLDMDGAFWRTGSKLCRRSMFNSTGIRKVDDL